MTKRDNFACPVCGHHLAELVITRSAYDREKENARKAEDMRDFFREALATISYRHKDDCMCISCLALSQEENL